MKKNILIGILVVIIIALIGALGVVSFKYIMATDTIPTNVSEDDDSTTDNGLEVDKDGKLKDENYASCFKDGTKKYYKWVERRNSYLYASYNSSMDSLMVEVTKNTYKVTEGTYYVVGIEAEEVVDIQFYCPSDANDKASTIYVLTRNGNLYKGSLRNLGTNENITVKLDDKDVYRMDYRYVTDSEKFYDSSNILVIKCDGTSYEIKK